MCNNPITHGGLTFACRSCDECISQRRFEWVSRAMAEATLWQHVYSVTLTYNDETEFNRQGAEMFRYSDIQGFFNRLRSAARYEKDGEAPVIRYICAGEQGDRNGRCHWHVIIYSSVPVIGLGQMSWVDSRAKTRNDVVTSRGESAIRCLWSHWPHGYVTFQKPDEGGMHYVLSYALKDQFAADTAKGTGREARSEVLATGMFRMSKKPPIGYGFITAILEQLRGIGTVLPRAELSVPGLKGYWRPVGANRRLLLEGFAAINEEARAKSGRDCPHWAALVSSVRSNEKDMELLTGVTQIESIEDEEARASARRRDDRNWQEVAKQRRRCGSSEACTSCLRGASREALAARGIEAYSTPYGGQGFRYLENDPFGAALRRAQADNGRSGPNPLCELQGTISHRGVFSHTGSA